MTTCKGTKRNGGPCTLPLRAAQGGAGTTTPTLRRSDGVVPAAPRPPNTAGFTRRSATCACSSRT